MINISLFPLYAKLLEFQSCLQEESHLGSYEKHPTTSHERVSLTKINERVIRTKLCYAWHGFLKSRKGVRVGGGCACALGAQSKSYHEKRVFKLGCVIWASYQPAVGGNLWVSLCHLKGNAQKELFHAASHHPSIHMKVELPKVKV